MIGKWNDCDHRVFHSSQSCHAVYAQTIVDDCQRISRRPHLAGANEMITAVAILAGEAKPCVVSLQIVSGVVPRGICGVPVWWFSASRTVTSSLPLSPNSGQ